MPTIIYKYLPRFSTGLFLVKSKPGCKPGVYSYRLLTGKVTYPTAPGNFLAEVEYLNLFGFILFPTITFTFRKK